MKALLCESFGDLTGVRNHDDDPVPVEYDADGAVAALLPHVSDGCLAALLARATAEAEKRLLDLDPPTPLLLAAVDTDAQEGE